jgi:hypothetical protein
MLAVLEIGQLVAGFCVKYAKPLLGVGCVAFMLLWSNSCINCNSLSMELEACRSKPPTIQTVTVQGKATQVVKVIYKDGSPCPDVTATNDSEFSATVTQTAQATCPPSEHMGPLTFGLGAAYYQGIWHPAAGVGVALVKVGGYEFGAGVDVAAAAFDGVPGLDPMGMVKMTVRR